jgi:hypothetical protein
VLIFFSVKSALVVLSCISFFNPFRSEKQACLGNHRFIELAGSVRSPKRFVQARWRVEKERGRYACPLELFRPYKRWKPEAPSAQRLCRKLHAGPLRVT